MKIITIDREFAAGGHSVGWRVAEKLGIEFYDRDIIREAATKSGLSPDLIEADEERISKGHAFIKAISPISYDDKDTIFTYESQAIIGFAKKGPCVVLGRCAKEILEDAGFDVLSVFLHSPEEYRVNAAKKILDSEDEALVRRILHKTDIARQAYVAFYTERQWHNANEYSIALDTHTLGYDACADIICTAAQLG